MNSKLLSIMFFAGLFLFSQSNAVVVSAQELAGVSVSPALIEETVDPGNQKEYSFTVKNLNETEQTFFISAKNIVDVRDGGVPIFAKEGDEKTGMELADWLQIPVTQMTLASGASEEVRFIMNVPGNASPGSHFGSVFISVDPPEIENSGAAIGYQVANIISIRVSGDAVEEAGIRQFSTKRYFNGSKNVDFAIRVENIGNVLIRPVGPLEIYNMLGQKVDTITFNEARNGVFPKSIREYATNWKGEGTGFGRYEAVVSPVYGEDGAKKTMSSTVSFWILPLHIIGPALAVLAFILLVTYLFVRIYIKRTVAHLTQGQGRVVRTRRKKGISATLLLVVVMLLVTAVFMLILLALFA